jgi:hypothetical protein
MAASHPVTGRTWPVGTALLLATLIAGTLDLGYAIVVSAFRGYKPLLICQSVASGLLGKATYEGGLATGALGVALHFTMMTCIVLAYYLLSRRLPQIARQPFIWGPLYGVGVFCVMNYVVVPLSAIGHTFQRTPLLFIGEMFSHVVFVGLTIAWFVSRIRRDAAA